MARRHLCPGPAPLSSAHSHYANIASAMPSTAATTLMSPYLLCNDFIDSRNAQEKHLNDEFDQSVSLLTTLTTNSSSSNSVASKAAHANILPYFDTPHYATHFFLFGLLSPSALPVVSSSPILLTSLDMPTSFTLFANLTPTVNDVC
jgi:hypothetical protein